MSKKIEFIDKTGIMPKEFFPKPAKRFIPEWYKKLDNVATELPEGQPFRAHFSTVKKCVPVFDSITAGYIIPLFTDVFVSPNRKKHHEKDEFGEPAYYWAEEIPTQVINFHPYEQIEGYPSVEPGHPMAKFSNPWGIKTPKGYSCLITTPSHRDIPFKILEAVVDTDRYTIPVEFLFTLKDPTFEGTIKAGTPMVQVIPFKRENWTHEVSSLNDNKKRISFEQNTYLLNTALRNRYRSHFWDRKHFD